jgi:hypothetical protein
MASDKLPPFPDHSVAVLKALATGVTRRRRPAVTSEVRQEKYPEKIVIRLGNRRFYVGRHVLTQDEIPIYEAEDSPHDSQDSALDAAYPSGQWIELEE